MARENIFQGLDVGVLKKEVDWVNLRASFYLGWYTTKTAYRKVQ